MGKAPEQVLNFKAQALHPDPLHQKALRFRVLGFRV